MKRKLFSIGLMLCLVLSSVIADDYVRETVEQANSRTIRYWNEYCKMRDEMIAAIDKLPHNRDGYFYWSDVNDTLMHKIATVDYYIWGIHELTMNLRDKGVQIPSFVDRAYERDKRWKEDNWFYMSEHQRQIVLWIKPSEFIIPEIID